MLLWLGIVTFVVGCAIWYRSRQPGARVPGTMARFGLGAAALGLGTLTMLQPGLGWTIASIGFSIIAIALIASVLVEIRKRQ
jgi:membrane protein implicated in regulation of membrane protease activity